MSIYKVENMTLISSFFPRSHSTLVTSCLTNYMGVAYVDCLKHPLSVQLSIGDFIFFSGIVNEQLLSSIETNPQKKEVIVVPQNQVWVDAITSKYHKKMKIHTRYATKREINNFNLKRLKQYISTLSNTYKIRAINKELYTQIIHSNWAKDLCNNYISYTDFIQHGLGYVILKNNKIVAGASSYSYYPNGIEIQIDTIKEERRQGLALVCGAKLILDCLKKGLYPSWDAHTKESLTLAQKLGYTLDQEYSVYILLSTETTLNP